MTEFKFYHLVCDIDFVANQKIVGNYHITANERLEMKAIRKYKDAIWDMQGLINNSIAIGNNEFDMFGNVTLYGVTYDNDYVTMRHLQLNLQTLWRRLTKQSPSFILQIVDRNKQQKGNNMNEVFVILAFPHTHWGETYIWKVFSSFNKAKKELNRLAEQYKMEFHGETEIIATMPPVKEYRFLAFEIWNFFVEQ